MHASQTKMGERTGIGIALNAILVDENKRGKIYETVMLDGCILYINNMDLNA